MEPTEILDNLKILPQIDSSNSLVGEGRFVEAMKPLEELVARGDHQGFIYLAIGDICRQLGREEISCNDEAKKFYGMAIDLANIEKDDQVIVAAKSGLAWIAIREAQNAFKDLPDISQWNDLKGIIPFFPEPEFIAFSFMGQPCSCSSSGGALKNGRYNDGECVAGGCRPTY